MSNQYPPRTWQVEKRLAALEKLVLKQHEIIGILINAGKRMEKKMEEEE